MKLNIKRNAGLIDVGAGLALLVLLLAIVFLGFLIYIFVRLAPRIKPRQLPPEEGRLNVSQPTTVELAKQFQFSYEAPGLTQAARTADPQGEWFTTIQRSTNLVDWIDLYTTNLSDQVEILDENPPWPNGFYRAIFWRKD